MKYRYGVEVALPREENNRMIECLRYANVLSVHAAETGQEDDKIIIWCPSCIGRPSVWAEMNAERMRTFGYKTSSVRKKQ